jgi:hypothetical protein
MFMVFSYSVRAREIVSFLASTSAASARLSPSSISTGVPTTKTLAAVDFVGKLRGEDCKLRTGARPVGKMLKEENAMVRRVFLTRRCGGQAEATEKSENLYGLCASV